MSVTQEVLKISQCPFTFWSLTNFYLSIFVFKAPYQGSSNLSLEVQSAAEFSYNPDQTHLPVIF